MFVVPASACCREYDRYAELLASRTTREIGIFSAKHIGLSSEAFISPQKRVFIRESPIISEQSPQFTLPKSGKNLDLIVGF